MVYRVDRHGRARHVRQQDVFLMPHIKKVEPLFDALA
jgi:hypothetical protein